MQAKSRDLTQGSIGKGLFFFALPIFMGTLFELLYTTADAIVVGRFAGVRAMAAIEAVHGLSRIPWSLFGGMVAGASILLSQYFGAKQEDKLSDASHNALFFALVFGAGLALLGSLLSPYAVGWVQVPEDILQDARSYLLISYLGVLPGMVYQMGAATLRAVGNSKSPFFYLVIANLTNVALDLLFVAGFGWGVLGAGIATLISQILSALLILFALCRSKDACRISFRRLRFYPQHLRAVWRLGLPIAFNYVMYPLSNTLLQSRINGLGIHAIASWALSGKLDFLIWAIGDSCSQACSTFVAQNFGAGKLNRAKKAVRITLLAGFFLLSMISISLYLWTEILAGFFIEDAISIMLTAQVMRFIAPFYPITILVEVLPSSIRGMGESFHPMLITLCCTTIARILWVFFVVPLNYTVFMVVACYPVTWCLAGLVYAIYYFFFERHVERKMQSA